MEQTSVDTQLSTTTDNDQQENMTIKDSNDSQEQTRPRGQSFWSAAKAPSRKFSFGNYFAHSKVKQAAETKQATASLWTWKTHKSVMVGTMQGDKSSTKIAMLDMDDTIIVNRTGRRVTDWEFLNASVPQRIRELHSGGYRIVIASNQLGVSLNIVSATDLQKKIQEFSSKIGVPMTAMLATKKDKFRKPDDGMWNLLVYTLNDNVAVEKDSCVYSSLPSSSWEIPRGDLLV